MKFWFANTANPKRIIMFLLSGAFGIFAESIFYQRAPGVFTIRFFIIYALIGILVFEFLYQTRKWLNLTTLAVYAILVVIVSRWLYFIFIRIGSGTLEINDIYLNPLRNITLLPPFIPSIFTTLITYLLISFLSDFRFILERSNRLFNRLSPKGNFAIGFFGWILFSNLYFLAILEWAYSLFYEPVRSTFILGLPALVLPIVFFAKKQAWVGTGILTAIFINMGMWISFALNNGNLSSIRILELIQTGLLPFPIGFTLFSQ